MPIVSPSNLATATTTVGPPPEAKQPDTVVQHTTPAVGPEPSAGEKESNAKFAALARKERQMRQWSQSQQQKLQAEKAQLQAERAQVEKARSWQTRLPEDPWSVMLEAGLTPEQISERVFSPEAIQKYNLQKYQSDLEQRVQTQINELKQSQAQQTTAQYEQAKKQIAQEVNHLVRGNESFETLQAMGAQAAVVELIEQTFNKSGILMSVEDAAKEVEDYLADTAFNLTKLSKVRSRLGTGNQVQQKQNQTQQPQANTLSNRSMPSTSRPLSARERRERAIAAFLGKI